MRSAVSIRKVTGELSIVLSSLFQRAWRCLALENPEPEIPLCIIGDVHGCFTLLKRMLTQVPQGARIVLTGDYIDRGQQSADVLRRLIADPSLTCLKGNHEDMLLRFLANPEREGPRWIRHGGMQTLASFGIQDAQVQITGDELRGCRNRMQDAMGEDLIAWIAALQTSVLSGNVLVVHAGADPRVSPLAQSEDTFLWGHPDFLRRARRDGTGRDLGGARSYRCQRSCGDKGPDCHRHRSLCHWQAVGSLSRWWGTALHNRSHIGRRRRSRLSAFGKIDAPPRSDVSTCGTELRI